VTQASPQSEAPRRSVLRALCVFGLAVLHWQILMRVVSLVPSALASQGVLDGLPHWRIYQSRVLGPLLMGSIERWGSTTYLPAYLSGVLLALLGTHALLWLFYARQRLSLGRSAALSLALIAASVPLVRSEWFYIWDALSLLFVTAFVVGVLSGFRHGVLALIFAAALLNHELSLFMPVWLIVERLCDAWRERRFRLQHALPLGAALLVIWAARSVIEWLRSTFLVREVGPEIFRDYDARFADPSLQWHLAPNLAELGRALAALQPRGLLGPALLVFCGLLVHHARSSDLRLRALALTFLLLLAATLGVGLVFETRVYLVFLPYVLSVPLAAAQRDRFMARTKSLAEWT